MGNLATVKKILSKSHFDESRISRDSLKQISGIVVEKYDPDIPEGSIT